jgi:hypothetical protein
MYGLALGINVAYNHAMFVGGGKPAGYKADIGTEMKYAGDAYEMTHDSLGQMLMKSPKGPTSWKLTHLFNTGAFWVLKPLVLVNAIIFVFAAVVLFIDPAHSFPFAPAFVTTGIVLALSIVQNLIGLLMAKYGSIKGFLKFLNMMFFKPAIAIFATSLHPAYSNAVTEDTAKGKDVFIPTTRGSLAKRRTTKDIYETMPLGAKIGTVLIPLLMFFAPYHPVVFLMSAVLYILLIFSYIIGPHLFNVRPIHINPLTNWAANLAVAATLGVLAYAGVSLTAWPI